MAIIWHPIGLLDQSGMAIDANGLQNAGKQRGRVNSLADQPFPPGGIKTPEELALAELIVSTLNLEVRPDEVDPEAPLYGEGLGLDSIDILEIALAISHALRGSAALG